jgi:hypothetical protein
MPLANSPFGDSCTWREEAFLLLPGNYRWRPKTRTVMKKVVELVTNLGRFSFDC